MQEGKFLILLVEDDKKLLETLAQFLKNHQYEVLQAEDGEKALDLYFSFNHKIDLLLLDVMLPKINGYQVLKQIREYSNVPAIMVTARDQEEDQLEGLKGGADNYITKPYRLRVLMAHIENLLKRTKIEREMVFGGLRMIVDKRIVLIGGTEVAVTPREFDLLLFFVRHKNQVLSREMILDSVWGYDYDGDPRTVDTLVKQLRKKMTGRYSYIHSVYGIGYCFKES